MEKKKILFICKDNSIHSQLAEAMVNHFFGERLKAYSAGLEPVQVNPCVAKSLAEIGIDIAKHYSKSVNEFKAMQFDVIITLCDYAKTFKAHFPKCKKQLHITFKECCVPICCDYARKFYSCFPEYRKQLPGQFKDSTSEEEITACFSHLREKIFDWFEKEAIF